MNWDLKRIERHRAFGRDSTPVLRALERHGIVVSAPYDVLSTRYVPLSQEVVDTLLDLLPHIPNEDVQECVVRLIGATKVSYDGRPLAELFDRGSDHLLKWAIGNTLSISRPLHLEEWLPSALRDPRHGKSREMLCVAIARIMPEQARAVLREVFGQLPCHAAMGLGKCGGPEEAEFLRKKAEAATVVRTRGSDFDDPEFVRKINSETLWCVSVRNDVLQAIKRIEKRVEKEQAKRNRSPKKRSSQ